MKRRGLIALIAGIFMVVLIGAVGVWVDRMFVADGAVADASTAQSLGRLNVAFAFIAIAAALGIINGWFMMRTGKRNQALVWTVVVVFIGGVFTAIV